MKKIVLITDVPPCSHYTAGIILKQYLKFLDPKQVAVFSVIDPSIRDVTLDADLRNLEFASTHKPTEEAVRLFNGPIGGAISHAIEVYREKTSMPAIIERAVSFAQEVRADAIWCVMQGQTLIRLAHQVANRLDLPLYTNVWDSPGWWFRERGIGRMTRKAIMGDFAKSLQRSSVVGCASPAMADDYQRSYGVKTATLLPCLSERYVRKPDPKLSTPDQFVITMAGQLYATEEWQALLRLLDTRNWQIAGRKVVVQLLNRGLILYGPGPMHFRYLGWRSQEETQNVLAESDVSFCPYWFDPVYETECRLSFPGKLTAFLAAGRPVFFLGPEYASPGRFLERYQAGANCNELNLNEIEKTLTRLIEDSEYYRTLVKNGFRAFNECLNENYLRRTVHQLLELPLPIEAETRRQAEVSL